MWEERQEAVLLEWRHTSRHKANDSLAPGRVPFQTKEKGRMSFIYRVMFFLRKQTTPLIIRPHDNKQVYLYDHLEIVILGVVLLLFLLFTNWVL